MENKQKIRKVTAGDVAALAGVSKWTVSRAFTPGASISDTARQQVMRAAKTLGYRPNLLARSLSNKPTHILGVALDQFRNPQSLRWLEVISRQLQARGYMALLLNIDDGENYQSAVGLADQLQVDGMIFLGTVLSDELQKVIRETLSIPLVQIGRNTDSSDIDIVNLDGFQAGEKIAELLLAQGHKTFAYMKGPDTEGSHLYRYEGYRACAGSTGQVYAPLLAGEYSRSAGHKAMQQYLAATPEPQWADAIFCENDILAFGVLDALAEWPVGKSVAVVGFDNVPEAESIGLTTYDQCPEKLVAEALHRIIDGEVSESGDWLQGQLVIRQTHRRK